MTRHPWNTTIGSVTLALLAATGCMSSPSMVGPSGRSVDVDGSSSGAVVTAHVGDEVRVTLQTIGPGQYGDPSVSSSVLRYDGVDLVGPPNPGGPKQLFRFSARARGRASVEIA